MYVAMAFRYGRVNVAGNYILGAGTDLEELTAIAKGYCLHRGGKYGCAVLSLGSGMISLEALGCMGEDLVAYFPSAMKEGNPFIDTDREGNAAVGREVMDAIRTGKIFFSVPVEGNTRFMKRERSRVAVPDWLKEKALKTHKAFKEIWDEE